MPARVSYRLIGAPSGTGEKQILDDLPHVNHVDIESFLLDEVQEDMEDLGFTDDPYTIGDVIDHLAKNVLRERWEEAATRAFAELEEMHHAEPELERVVSCNFVYYSNQREEFFSPAFPQSFLRDDWRPISVVVLFDDIYDMFVRLAGKDEVFAIDDARDKKETASLPRSLEEAYYQWLFDVLGTIIQWRAHEIREGARVATGLQKQFAGEGPPSPHFLPLGVKHLSGLIEVMVGPGTTSPVYMSHPISRLRRETDAGGNGLAEHTVVKQLEKINAEMAEGDTLAIMPTAIDEYRIVRSRWAEDGQIEDEEDIEPGFNPPPGELEHTPIDLPDQFGEEQLQHGDEIYLPALSPRWPISEPPENGVMYGQPEVPEALEFEDGAPSYRDFFRPQWGEIEAPMEGVIHKLDGLLRSFESSVLERIRGRDHRLVGSCSSGILLVRPYYGGKKLSSGVSAEYRYFTLLKEGVDLGDGGRRIALVHHSDDLISLLAKEDGTNQYDSGDKFDRNRKNHLREILQDEYPLEPDQARELSLTLVKGEDVDPGGGSFAGVDEDTIREIDDEQGSLLQEASDRALDSFLYGYGYIKGESRKKKAKEAVEAGDLLAVVVEDADLDQLRVSLDEDKDALHIVENLDDAMAPLSSFFQSA